MRRAALLLLGCAFCVGIVHEPGRSEEPEYTTAKVLTAWKKRREAVWTIDYVAIGEKIFLKGSMTDDFRRIGGPPIGVFPPQDRVFAVSFRFAARLRDRKLRFERQDEYPMEMREGPPVFFTDYRSYLFDGNKGFKYIPDEHFDPAKSIGPQMQAASDDAVRFFIESKDHPFLLAHGIVPIAARNTTIDDLAAPPIEIPYSLVDSAPRQADGMLVLRSKPMGSDRDLYNEIWVDAKRGYLITRLISSRNTKALETTDLTYKAAGDDWSLSEWKFICWGNAGIERSYKMKVKSVKINEELSDELFVPPVKNRP